MEDLKYICYNYDKELGQFTKRICSDCTSYYSTRELCKIIKYLEDKSIEFSVDEGDNIKILSV